MSISAIKLFHAATSSTIQNFTMSNVVTPDVDVQLHAVAYAGPLNEAAGGGPIGNARVGVWRASDQVLLADESFAEKEDAGEGWADGNTFWKMTLATPVTLVGGTQYKIGVWSQESQYYNSGAGGAHAHTNNDGVSWSWAASHYGSGFVFPTSALSSDHPAMYFYSPA